MLQIVKNANRSFGKVFFVEVAFIACSNIWKVRNKKSSDLNSWFGKGCSDMIWLFMFTDFLIS